MIPDACHEPKMGHPWPSNFTPDKEPRAAHDIRHFVPEYGTRDGLRNQPAVLIVRRVRMSVAHPGKLTRTTSPRGSVGDHTANRVRMLLVGDAVHDHQGDPDHPVERLATSLVIHVERQALGIRSPHRRCGIAGTRSSHNQKRQSSGQNVRFPSHDGNAMASMSDVSTIYRRRWHECLALLRHPPGKGAAFPCGTAARYGCRGCRGRSGESSLSGGSVAACESLAATPEPDRVNPREQRVVERPGIHLTGEGGSKSSSIHKTA